MFVKAFIFSRNNCLLEFLGSVLNLDIGSPLLAELANQLGFGAIDLKRDFGLVTG